METKQAVTALAALAHDTRLRVFRLLVQQGPTGLPAGEIPEPFVPVLGGITGREHREHHQ